MKNKVLITGGSGLLALNWALTINKNFDVFLGYHKRQFNILNTKSIKLELEIYDELYSQLSNLSPKIIINTAGLTNVESCEKFPKLANKSNITIAKNLAKVSKFLNIKLVHISTDHLFDGKKTYYNEKDQINPLNVYGKTKAIGEKEILKINEDALIIRTNFFGWGTDYRNSFSDFIIQNLENKNKIYLFEDVFFTPIIISRLTNIVHKLIKSDASGIYNVASDERISKFDFGIKIAKIFGLDSSLIIKSSMNKILQFTKRPKEMSLKIDKLKKKLNLKSSNLDNDIKQLKIEKNKLGKILKPFIPYGKHHISENDITSVENVLRHGWLTQGPKVEEFEEKIAKYVGSKFAVAVTSCTAGLHLAYAAAGMKKNDYLITTPITFVSTASAALMNEGSLIFSDIEKNSINLCFKELARTIEKNKKNKKIKIITPVHFGGAPCEMKEINKIAKSVNAVVIEDAAHALGSYYKNGKRIGCCDNSLMTVFSFHPVKAIATGEGGMITTNDENIYKKLLRLRSHGINKLDDNYINQDNAYTNNKFNPWYYEMQSLGYHYRLNDIQCALGISQLKQLDIFLKKRRKIVDYYDKNFLKHDKIKITQKNFRSLSSHHLYIIKVDFNNKHSRQKVMKKLFDLGIGTQVHYIPLPMHPYFCKKGFKISDYPNSLKYYSQALSLPIYYDLSREQQDKVINCLKKIII